MRSAPGYAVTGGRRGTILGIPFDKDGTLRGFVLGFATMDDEAAARSVLEPLADCVIASLEDLDDMLNS